MILKTFKTHNGTIVRLKTIKYKKISSIIYLFILQTLILRPYAFKTYFLGRLFLKHFIFNKIYLPKP